MEYWTIFVTIFVCKAVLCLIFRKRLMELISKLRHKAGHKAAKYVAKKAMRNYMGIEEGSHISNTVLNMLDDQMLDDQGKVKNISVNNVMTGLVASLNAQTQSTEIDYQDNYIVVKDGKKNIYARYDSGLALDVCHYILMGEKDDDGDIIPFKPGVEFQLTPSDLGFDKMVVMEKGKIVEEVEANDKVSSINLQEWF